MWIMSPFYDFAVFDAWLLTQWINCSMYHLLSLEKGLLCTVRQTTRYCGIRNGRAALLSAASWINYDKLLRNAMHQKNY